MIKAALKYGLMAGLMIFIIGFVPLIIAGGPQELGYGISEVLGYASMILSLLFIIIAVKQYRDKQLRGKISFGKALGLGLLVSVVAGIILVVGDTIYLLYIDPDFAVNHMEHQIGVMRDSGVSETEIQAMQQQMVSATWIFEVVMFLTVFFFGLIISLITAAIYKKK